MKQSLKIGLFIGVSIASLCSAILQFFPFNYWTVIILLYLYIMVGVLTSYMVHKNLTKRTKIKLDKKFEELISKLD